MTIKKTRSLIEKQKKSTSSVVGEKLQEKTFTKKIFVKAKNKNQSEYLKLLNDDATTIVLATGVAGTGKTYLATKWAIKQLLEGKFKKIVITRPAVLNDENLGFLPGDLKEKMDPWLLPITDVFLEDLTKEQLQRLYDENKLEIAPIAFLRGRTFNDCVVIGDEMQNTTPKQFKTLLTRIGTNSKLLLTGDVTQHDRGYERNGMNDFIQRLGRYEDCAIKIISFDINDVERSDIIKDVLEIYGEDSI